MGRDADAYYRSHHEIDTVIGHALGGAVAFKFRTHIKTQNKVITHMEYFNLKHLVRQLFQVI